MSKTTVLTTRVSDELFARLDQLATELERSRAWIIAKAIERYVDEELAFVEFVREGKRDLDEGRVFTQEQVEAMFKVTRAARDAA